VTGKKIGEEIYIGYEGEKYKTEAKEFKGYILVAEHYPENAEGIMTKEELHIKYYYARVAKVEVEYIDQETGARIIEKVVIEGHEGKKYKTEVKVFEGYKLFNRPENAEGKMKITEDEDGELENTTKVRYYYKKVKEEDKPKEDIPTTITNIYNNGTKADTNGNSNNNLNGNSSGNSGNSNNGNYTSNNNTGLSNYEKTPGTGDILPIVAGVTILGLLVLNIVLWVVHKKCKNKKNFIK